MSANEENVEIPAEIAEPRQVAGTRLRRVLFVIPNLEKDEVVNVKLFDVPWIRRWVYQIEAAPTTGMLHAQGYIEFNTRKYFTEVYNYMKGFYKAKENSPRLFAPKGTCKQCYDYCTKQETRVDGPYEGGMATWESTKQWELVWLQWNSDEGFLPDNIYEMIGEY